MQAGAHTEKRNTAETDLHSYLPGAHLPLSLGFYIHPSIFSPLSRTNEALILMRPHFLKCYKDVAGLQEKQLSGVFNSKQLTY